MTEQITNTDKDKLFLGGKACVGGRTAAPVVATHSFHKHVVPEAVVPALPRRPGGHLPGDQSCHPLRIW